MICGIPLVTRDPLTFNKTAKISEVYVKLAVLEDEPSL